MKIPLVILFGVLMGCQVSRAKGSADALETSGANQASPAPTPKPRPNPKDTSGAQKQASASRELTLANPSKPCFTSISFVSRPKGWGMAFKEVQGNGHIGGGHMSGGPLRGGMTASGGEDRVSAGDYDKLCALARTLRKERCTKDAPEFDKKKTSSFELRVTFDDDTQCVFRTEFEVPFPSETAKAIGKIISGYNVGYW
jgi:hypothetical protein